MEEEKPLFEHSTPWGDGGVKPAPEEPGKDNKVDLDKIIPRALAFLDKPGKVDGFKPAWYVAQVEKALKRSETSWKELGQKYGLTPIKLVRIKDCPRLFSLVEIVKSESVSITHSTRKQAVKVIINLMKKPKCFTWEQDVGMEKEEFFRHCKNQRLLV